jgi:Zn-dependent peptidase ImmA (M78 family)
LPRADAVAAELLRAAGVVDPPVDVEWLARQQGARVIPEELDSEVSGVLYREPDNVIIAVNRHHAATRRRFTVAHELGHLLLHQGRPVIVDHVVRARINLRDHRSSLATEREEIEANRFAAYLLMPPKFVHDELEAALRRGLDEHATIERLARRFGVSAQAMEFRLTNLGLRAAV